MQSQTEAVGVDRILALPGLMMDFPLTVQHIIGRMASVNSASKVVTLTDPDTGACLDRSFGEVVRRASRLANALQRLGVRPGDRVGSLAWNNGQHLEIYLAVMGMGAVLHTMNVRLFGEQLAYTVNHADDRVVIAEASLASQFAEIVPDCSGVRDVIVFSSDDDRCAELPEALDYEELLAQEASEFAWPALDERSAAALCYTSGTTGDPKGVLYSHRSIVLHALNMSSADIFGITGRDRVLAAVPLFHAMGWGLPFVCGLVGSDIIMPSRYLQPGPLGRLIHEQRATWTAGVPTVWLDLLHYLDTLGADQPKPDPSSLRTILSGGTAVPENLVEEYRERFGSSVIEGWGMTEIFPGATMGRRGPGGQAENRNAGRISPLYELRLIGAEGQVLPHDGVAVGEVEVRGPSVASGYFNAADATAEVIHDGWLRTGDVAAIDAAGYLRITDRAKDVIKSGGEWISSQDLEKELMAHPAVREAAVVAVPDERWGERPFAFVVLGTEASQADLQEFLAARVARWWVPERFEFVSELARTTTGKFDKKELRRSISPDRDPVSPDRDPGH